MDVPTAGLNGGLQYETGRELDDGTDAARRISESDRARPRVDARARHGWPDRHGCHALLLLYRPHARLLHPVSALGLRAATRRRAGADHLVAARGVRQALQAAVLVVG